MTTAISGSNSPLVSIVTTFYNSESLGNFVENAMESLQNQTYKNLELICVNDGSTDQTLKQLQTYAESDSRIKIIDKVNQKVAQFAKAAGQKAATGKYIFLYDHDDKITKNVIESAVIQLEKNQDWDVATPVVAYTYPDGKIRFARQLAHKFGKDEKTPYYFEGTLTGKEVLNHTIGPFNSSVRGLWRKEIFQSVPFDSVESLMNGDEYIERLLFLNCRKIGTSQGTYTHFIFPNSSAKSYSIKKIDMVVTDQLIRELAIKNDCYTNNAENFEKFAFRNLVNAMKIYQHFKKNLAQDEKEKQLNRMKSGYSVLQKDYILRDNSFKQKIFHQLLLINFKTFEIILGLKK